MDDKSFNIRVPKKWARVAMIVGVTALIVAPLTAIASHSFTDVPDSNTFHSDIAWLADAGVTKGCNPPDNTEFCPDDNVTRGQMAAFQRRFAQYIGAEDGAPAHADNADTVDGLHASQLLRAGTDGGNTSVLIDGTNLSAGANVLNEVNVTAPQDGGLLVMWSAFQRCSGADIAEVRLHVDGTGDNSFFVPPECAAADDFSTHTFHTLIPISAGAHQLQIRASDFDGAPNNLRLEDSRLTVAFVAFDLDETSSFASLGTFGDPPSGDGPGS